MSQALAHPTMTDPRTGEPLLALGTRADGRPIWPIMGGAPEGEGDGEDNGEDGTGDGEDQDRDEDREDDEDDPRVRRANRQAQNYRQRLRDAESEVGSVREELTETRGILDRLRAAITGEDGDGEDQDPTEQVTELTSRVENLSNENQELRGQLLVHELAEDAGANPQALLDSRRFANALRKIDASADDYRDQVLEAMEDAVERNSNLRAAQGAPRGGAEGAGRSGDGAVTAEQFARMGYRERAELFENNPTLYRKLAG